MCDFHTGQWQALSLSTSPVGTQHVEQGHRGWGQWKQTRLRPLSFLGLRVQTHLAQHDLTLHKPLTTLGRRERARGWASRFSRSLPRILP